jgi:hypothetical protein
MAQLSTNRIVDFDLSTGLSVFAGIAIKKTANAGRKVLFQFRRSDVPLEVTIGMDEHYGLRIWLIDASGKSHVSDPLAKECFFERVVLLNAEIRPLADGGTALCLRTSRKDQIETVVNADLGAIGPARFSMGATLENAEPAAFELAEFIMYERPLDSADLEQTRKYFEHEFKISSTNPKFYRDQKQLS